MVDQCNFVIHGCLFLAYTATVLFWSIWNVASNAAFETNFLTLPNFQLAYMNWLRSYYQCLFVFSVANGLVQLFTIYIFFKLTRKIPTTGATYKVRSDSVEQDIERIGSLDGDRDHVQKSKFRQDTEDLTERETSFISANDNRRVRAASDDFAIKVTELDKSTRHRIFAQFMKNADDENSQSVTNKTARTAATTADLRMDRSYSANTVINEEEEEAQDLSGNLHWSAK